MAKWKSNIVFNTYLIDTTRNTIKRIKSSVFDIYKEATELLCEVFVQRARARLSKNQNAAKYANNIYYRLNGASGEPEIIVKENEEGIMTFLEYGTGIMGKNNPHPLAQYGWQYAINITKYRTVKGKLGFFFRNTKNHYIDPNDSVKTVISRRGDYFLEDSVFSQGIKPLRYIYDTEIEIIREYNNSNDIFDFISRLKKLKGSAL